MPDRADILLVEDDADARRILRAAFERDGFAVREAACGTECLAAVEHSPPSLVLLDLMLPDMGGLEVCRRLRASPSLANLPIIIVTARGTEVDRVLGLEVGADDYVTKPFSPRELIARARAVLRRTGVPRRDVPHDVFAAGRLFIDFDSRDVRLDGTPVHLSAREFDLLRFFVRHPHRVYDRAQLLELVWGGDVHVRPRTVDAHVRRLRRRIEGNRSLPALVVTVRGVGYKFNAAALEVPAGGRGAAGAGPP